MKLTGGAWSRRAPLAGYARSSALRAAMMNEEEWDYADLGDRFLAEFCDGAIALFIAVPAWL